MGDVRDKDRSGIQDSNSVTEDSAWEHRRREGQGRGHRSSTVERIIILFVTVIYVSTQYLFSIIVYMYHHLLLSC